MTSKNKDQQMLSRSAVNQPTHPSYLHLFDSFRPTQKYINNIFLSQIQIWTSDN